MIGMIENIPGWNPMIKMLVDMCETNGGIVEQVKEKFGGLRFYYTDNIREGDKESEMFWEMFRKLVFACEDMSLYVCEETGHEGAVRNSKNGKYAWVTTLSRAKAIERGYDVD